MNIETNTNTDPNSQEILKGWGISLDLISGFQPSFTSYQNYPTRVRYLSIAANSLRKNQTSVIVYYSDRVFKAKAPASCISMYNGCRPKTKREAGGLTRFQITGSIPNFEETTKSKLKPRPTGSCKRRER
jgi:hypothetical protein